ncbi:MAG: DUF3800 domain-containing protein [Verrucomicrobia bacterium]|nr:DUF3800 domain-containing protein [Verrucomicrobiota bacterium]
MWWLYLDESGDLGFDFVNRKPSNFFTVCILATSSGESNKGFSYATKKTLRRKINHRRKRHPVSELHASSTTLEVKQYMYSQLSRHRFGIYAVTLNKRRVYDKLADNKSRVYNFIARQVLDRIPFEDAAGPIQLIIDRSKGGAEIREFNSYIDTQLKGRLDPAIALTIQHRNSCDWHGLQVVDSFAWGIFRKYERGDTAYHDQFREKVLLDEQYL